MGIRTKALLGGTGAALLIVASVMAVTTWNLAVLIGTALVFAAIIPALLWLGPRMRRRAGFDPEWADYRWSRERTAGEGEREPQ
jgi:hypothetical protein